jgi:CheY-like chemotaxis protein
VATLLLIDDDKELLRSIAVLMSLDGHKIVGEAGNGEEALRVLLDGCNPDVILLDLYMPIMNGWQFLERLRGFTAQRVPPVIVVSALQVGAGAPSPPVVAQIDKHSIHGIRLTSAIQMATSARAERRS